jgi:hypothetical protein
MSVRLILAAAFLLSTPLAAQESAEHARASAFREAERFTSCVMSRNAECVAEMYHLPLYEATGMATRDSDRPEPEMPAYREGTVLARRPDGLRTSEYSWMEVAEPWPLFAVGEVLYSFVPYFATFGDPERGRQVDRMSYLIGASEDDGESWRFVAVRNALLSSDIERAIPGHGDTPRPEFRDVEVDNGPFRQSRWLETTERRFVPVDDGYAYTLAVATRQEFDAPIEINVRYDNPADRNQPSSSQGSLEVGETALRWQSPPLTGFVAGASYEVVVEGRDADTGDRLFEHREVLLFQPTRELWLSVMSKPPAQLNLEQSRASAMRDAERFVICWMNEDLACLAQQGYSDPALLPGSLSRGLNALSAALSIAYNNGGPMPTTVGSISGGYSWMEVAEPWPPFAANAALYVFVPYFAALEDPVKGHRIDRMSYLIGQSADGGASWRFTTVRYELRSKEIDRIIPGYGDVPRPEFRDVVVDEARPERSQWLETTVRQIVPADEGYAYVLAFAIRQSFATPVDITVRYDNPAHPDEPSSVRGSLEPGQSELRWQSPPLEGFEADRVYEVVIEGSDPDFGSPLFEHREEVLFPPTRELWLSVMSKPPEAPPTN